MDYRLNIQEDINWLNESIYLLAKVYKYKGEFDKEKFTLIENEDKFSLSIEEIHEIFPDVLVFQVNILQDANELYEPGSIWESFTRPLDLGREYDSLLTSISMNTKCNRIEDISKEEFLLMNFREFFYLYYKQGIEIQGYDELQENKYKSSYFTEDSYHYNLEDIYELVEKTNLDSEQKFALIKTYAEIDEVYEDFILVIKECEKIIKKHYYLIEERVKEKVTELKAENARKKVEEIFRIEDLFQNVSDRHFNRINFSGQYFVYVGIVIYNGGMVRTASVDNHSPYIIFGLILEELIYIKQNSKLAKREIIDKTKAIGDETRFRILESLSDRPYYLKELADKFETSSASISHHLSILSSSGLVGTYYDDRKAYYVLNKKAFRSLADFLMDFSKEEKDGEKS